MVCLAAKGHRSHATRSPMSPEKPDVPSCTLGTARHSTRASAAFISRVEGINGIREVWGRFHYLEGKSAAWYLLGQCFKRGKIKIIIQNFILQLAWKVVLDGPWHLTVFCKHKCFGKGKVWRKSGQSLKHGCLCYISSGTALKEIDCL